MVAFQILRVYSANFSKIHQNAFRGLTSLRHLLIYGTALKHAPILTHIRSTLESLDLASNNIASIPPRYFANCSQINYISLKRNQLAVLPDLFGVAHSVVTLLFRHNQIRDIGNLYKYHFSLLQVIDLSSNLIQSIDVLSRLNWTKVRTLSVYENPIEIVVLPLPYDNARRFWLHLGNNPVSCNITSRWNQFCERDVTRFARKMHIRMNCTHNLLVLGICYDDPHLPGR